MRGWLACALALTSSLVQAQGLSLGIWPSLGVSSGGATYMAGPIIVPSPVSGTTLTNNATHYMGLAASSPNVVNASLTEGQVSAPVAANIDITGLIVYGATNAVTGSNWAITLRDLTPSPVNTPITCQVGYNVNNCSDNYASLNHHAVINQGDLIDLAIAPTLSPTASGFSFAFMMRSRDGQSLPLFFGTAAAVALNVVQSFWMGTTGSVVLPFNGHIDNLYVQSSGAVGGTGDSYTAYYGACGSEAITNLTTGTIASGSAAGQDINAADGFDVVAGNCLEIKSGGTGTSSATNWINGSVRWSPGSGGVNYQYPLFSVGTTLLTSVTNKWCVGSNGAQCQTAGLSAAFPDLVTFYETRTGATANNIFVNTDVAPTVQRNWSLVAGSGTTTGATNCAQTTTTSCSGSVSSALTPGTGYNILTAPTATGGTSPTAHWRVGYGVTVQ